MVSSYTALRTMLSLRYDKRAHTTHEGELFVEGLTKDLISPTDLLQYKIRTEPNGSYWLIPGHEKDLLLKRQKRDTLTLPSSYRLFMSRVQHRPEVKIIQITDVDQCYLHHVVDNLHNYNDDCMASYKCIMLEFGDMYTSVEIAMMLAGVIWVQSEKYENKVKVYFVKYKARMNASMLSGIANMTYLLLNSKADEWEETYGLLASYGEAKAKNPIELTEMFKEYEESENVKRLKF